MQELKINKKQLSYWGSIREAIHSLWKGLVLSLRHIIQAKKRRKNNSISNSTYFSLSTGIVTLAYPHEKMEVPTKGRYQLHNEIDDCIVCDKCAKICPVDCIEMEAIKSPEEIGKTSDGTSKRLYAAKFEIDMGKCCYCGLCTTVCPTECLTMLPIYDYSVTDMNKMIFEFSDLTTEQIEEKKKEAAIHQEKKEKEKKETSIKSENKTIIKPKISFPKKDTDENKKDE